jgi:ubiquinone biosynthesis protein COQ9
MDYTIRVIARSLISGTVTVKAQSKAEALAEVEQRINPKLRQEGYEFQLEFLETVERAQSAAA